MKCHVINLDRSPSRLAGMTELFAAARAPFERFAAVDGEHLSPERLADHAVTRQDYRTLTASEIGCFLSHRGCWESIAAGAEPFAAVFEDDIHFSRNGTACLKAFDWIPADADLIKLETYKQKVCVGRRAIATPVNYSVTRLWSTHWGTAGYIISRKCAAELVGKTRQFSVTVDDALFNPRFAVLGKAVVYQIMPALCVQRRFSADPGTHDADESTVTSLAPGPEYEVAERSWFRRKLLRIKSQISRFRRRQVMLRIPFHPAGDTS